MPQVVDNPDGTKTFSINSDELLVVRNLVGLVLPEVQRMLRTLQGPQIRAAWDFIRSVVA
jgi:hypothetical protein